MRPRVTDLSLMYNGVDSTKQIARHISKFSYTDVASGTSDSISIEVNDRDRKWINAWFPVKGDRLTPTIILRNWETEGSVQTIKCGVHTVDDFSFKGNPLTMELEAVALPADNGFHATARTFTYENTTLQEIGSEIATRASITLYYEAKTIPIEKVEQNEENDCSFYSSLLTRYGLVMKIYNNRLVVFDEADYEAKPAVATLTEGDFDPDWDWNTTLDGTYTGVNYEYKNSDTDETYTVKIGGGDRMYACNEAASNQSEATIIALAAVNNANRGMTTMKIKVMADPKYIATSCVEIAGLGKLSGKYYVESVTHEIGEGYKMELSMRLVEERIQKEEAKLEPEEKGSDFKKGDKVILANGALTYNNETGLQSWCYGYKFEIIQVGGRGLPDDRVVIGINGVVTAAVKASDLTFA